MLGEKTFLALRWHYGPVFTHKVDSLLDSTKTESKSTGKVNFNTYVSCTV